MMFWVAVIVTVLALLLTGIVYIGNRGSFHNFIDPRADWILVAAGVVVLIVWAIALAFH